MDSNNDNNINIHNNQHSETYGVYNSHIVIENSGFLVTL